MKQAELKSETINAVAHYIAQDSKTLHAQLKQITQAYRVQAEKRRAKA